MCRVRGTAVLPARVAGQHRVLLPKLGASSGTSVKYRLIGVVGGQFRIRGDFNRAKGDSTNKNASSASAYFTVTS